MQSMITNVPSDSLGEEVGINVAVTLGISVDGIDDGLELGAADGDEVGVTLGVADGVSVDGIDDGLELGAADGDEVGVTLGVADGVRDRKSVV